MKTVRTWCVRILMILFTIIFLYPLFWNLMSAFKTNTEYLTDPYALPAALNFDNFIAAWGKANIAAYFGNSVLVTVLSTVLLLLFVIPISYALARYRFVGEQADLNYLYGMHFPAGNLYYDSSVSGITGNKRIEQSSGTVPCLCSHAVSVLYFYPPGLYVRRAKGL